MEYYRFFPSLYRDDTLHLSVEQDGIYRRLLDHYYESRRPLPDNDSALARIASISIDLWNAHAAVLRAFFVAKNGKLFHKRCDKELSWQDTKTRVMSEKAKKGAETRWKKNSRNQKDTCQTHNVGLHDECLKMPEERRGEEKKGEDSIYEAEFSGFWEIYPKKVAKTDAIKSYKKARKEVDHETIMHGLRKYADERSGKDHKYTANAATWLNGKRWGDEFTGAGTSSCSVPLSHGNGGQNQRKPVSVCEVGMRVAARFAEQERRKLEPSFDDGRAPWDDAGPDAERDTPLEQAVKHSTGCTGGN